MKRYFAIILFALFLCGCDTLRFAPDQEQRQNAWLHNRTAQMAADIADRQEVSEPLKGLTKLSEIQSRAFSAYCGLPEEFPKAETIEDVLVESSFDLARNASASSANRPDLWNLADSAIELGIGIAALFGGIYGVKASTFLKQARFKSDALREVITGNELFKQNNINSVGAFKLAHDSQSPQTRKIVTEIKNK
jgi:hypothetical protein